MSDQKSSDRKISCRLCGKHVGIIRDAKLLKGLKFLCPVCDNILMKLSDKQTQTDAFMNFLNIFSMGNDKK